MRQAQSSEMAKWIGLSRYCSWFCSSHPRLTCIQPSCPSCIHSSLSSLLHTPPTLCPSTMAPDSDFGELWAFCSGCGQYDALASAPSGALLCRLCMYPEERAQQSPDRLYQTASTSSGPVTAAGQRLRHGSSAAAVHSSPSIVSSPAQASVQRPSRPTSPVVLWSAMPGSTIADYCKMCNGGQMREVRLTGGEVNGLPEGLWLCEPHFRTIFDACQNGAQFRVCAREHHAGCQRLRAMKHFERAPRIVNKRGIPTKLCDDCRQIKEVSRQRGLRKQRPAQAGAPPVPDHSTLGRSLNRPSTASNAISPQSQSLMPPYGGGQTGPSAYQPIHVPASVPSSGRSSYVAPGTLGRSSTAMVPDARQGATNPGPPPRSVIFSGFAMGSGRPGSSQRGAAASVQAGPPAIRHPPTQQHPPRHPQGPPVRAGQSRTQPITLSSSSDSGDDTAGARQSVRLQPRPAAPNQQQRGLAAVTSRLPKAQPKAQPHARCIILGCRAYSRDLKRLSDEELQPWDRRGQGARKGFVCDQHKSVVSADPLNPRDKTCPGCWQTRGRSDFGSIGDYGCLVICEKCATCRARGR